jgi:MFS family permease
MSTGAAGTIGTVTVVTSSFGGWFAGALADRFGRVRVLQIAILWYSVFTFLCAFAQSFEQLFILRGLHGLGFGGEWATGAVLMGEVIRDKYARVGVRRASRRADGRTRATLGGRARRRPHSSPSRRPHPRSSTPSAARNTRRSRSA